MLNEFGSIYFMVKNVSAQNEHVLEKWPYPVPADMRSISKITCYNYSFIYIDNSHWICLMYEYILFFLPLLLFMKRKREYLVCNFILLIYGWVDELVLTWA